MKKPTLFGWISIVVILAAVVTLILFGMREFRNQFEGEKRTVPTQAIVAREIDPEKIKTLKDVILFVQAFQFTYRYDMNNMEQVQKAKKLEHLFKQK